jgi:hypothetical protein
LSAVEIVLCQTAKLLGTVNCVSYGCDCILEKAVLESPSCVNTQRIIPERKVYSTLDRVIEISDSIGGKEHYSLIIL